MCPLHPQVSAVSGAGGQNQFGYNSYIRNIEIYGLLSSFVLHPVTTVITANSLALGDTIVNKVKAFGQEVRMINIRNRANTPANDT